MIRVLIIEDERLFRESLTRRVQQFPDFAVAATAANGLEGLLEVGRVLPDVIFSDIRMPGMDGIDFLEQLRKDYGLVMVVFISGYPEFENARRALQLGAFDYLTKPIDDRELERLTARIRSHKREQDLLAAAQPAAEPSREIASWIEASKEWIRSHLHEASLDEAAREAKMNASAFSRKFSAEAGVTFIDYLTELRMERARALLTQSALKINEVARTLGYNDQRYFSEIFKKHAGCGPQDYRRRSQL